MSYKNTTFCILPWMHAQTKPNGQIKPCCRFDHKNPAYKQSNGTYTFDQFNINNGTTFTQALESPEWETIRQQMENDQRVAGCWKCYKEENDHDVAQQGKAVNPKISRSMRSKENWLWNMDNQDGIDTAKNTKSHIRYLELALGTFCNLKCRTCTADLSSSWVEDETVLSKYYSDRRVYNQVITIEENWDVRDFQHVEEIKFTGGEPMLHPNFIKIIDIILATGRQHLITLDIFTNASWIPRDKVLSRLKQFKTVRINLSVDGVGKVNDYVRDPSDWPTVEAAVKQWLVAETDYPEVFLIKWCPCISLYNIWQFTKMVDWWVDLQNSVKKGTWWKNITYLQSNEQISVEQLNMTLNVAHEPKYIAVNNYPDKENLTKKLTEHKINFVKKVKEMVTDKTVNWAAELQLEGIYNKLLGALAAPVDPVLLQHFIEYTADLDKLRGQDLRKDIPELWDKIKDLVEYKGRINE